MALPCNIITKTHYRKSKDLPACWFSFSLPFNTCPTRYCRPTFTIHPGCFSPLKETKEMGREQKSFISFFHLNQSEISIPDAKRPHWIFFLLEQAFLRNTEVYKKNATQHRHFCFPTHIFSYNLASQQPTTSCLENAMCKILTSVCACVCVQSYASMLHNWK